MFAAQNTEAGQFIRRWMGRSQWRMWWRTYRIVCRETALATEDMMIYGTGFTITGPDVPDGIRRVPPWEVQIELP